ncbi:uncharacterized protein Z519_10744 [Cladophialophora bantiana CBS 173.52]|uniref:Ketoreductase domain-containing protein n=1 Tax=Cladophialophora bantiana (strain ATCC 10958 / CBS 173.52 / CDC B-1940 / NIH 8579) TaxID=1442370 RepID=A0A0D2H5V3_CLAB1|nr:uncharacterized protein Z519_10744 [Cladophialophora bantiana CBS 173.52]KIW88698.1 hypothetical protein Z519_10744 [Cladophialophora bantiana CBS 173.52]
MRSIALTNVNLEELKGKTVIVTGVTGGIGGETARTYHNHGSNVVLADLEQMRSFAEAVMASFSEPSRAMFVPVDILDWAQMTSLFRSTKERFGSVNVVVANAGVMESRPVLESNEADENSHLKEPVEAYKLCALLSSTWQKIEPKFRDGSQGSVVLVTSTSGYFGGTGVAAYVSSKHGATGLLRASQGAANKVQIRVNGIAPNFTATRLTENFAKAWYEAGFEHNTLHHGAHVIAQMSVDPSRQGVCCLIAGRILREMEHSRTYLLSEWLGDDLVQFMNNVGGLLAGMGGLPLPKLPALQQEPRRSSRASMNQGSGLRSSGKASM